MRVTTAFKRLLGLSGVTVADVVFHPGRVVVTVRLRSRKLRCPVCEHTTRARYDTRPVPSTWRHLDLCAWRLEVRANLRRLDCPVHGVRTEGVAFARAGSRFTRDFVRSLPSRRPRPVGMRSHHARLAQVRRSDLRASCERRLCRGIGRCRMATGRTRPKELVRCRRGVRVAAIAQFGPIPSGTWQQPALARTRRAAQKFGLRLAPHGQGIRPAVPVGSSRRDQGLIDRRRVLRTALGAAHLV